MLSAFALRRCAVLLTFIALFFALQRQWASVTLVKPLRRSGWQSLPLAPCSTLEARVVVYNRVPKSGSSSLKHILRQLAQLQGFRLVNVRSLALSAYYDLTPVPPEEVLVCNTSQLVAHIKLALDAPRRTLFFGHFQWPGVVDPRLVYINVVREPTASCTSWYYFSRYAHLVGGVNGSNLQLAGNSRRLPELTQRAFGNVTIDECLASHAGRVASADGPGSSLGDPSRRPRCLNCDWSHLTRFFISDESSALLSFEQVAGISGPRAAALAVEVLDAHYALVGLTEQLTSFVAVLERRLPAFFSSASDLWTRTPRQNAMHELAQYVPPSQASRAIMSRFLKSDARVYEHCRERFAAQLASCELRATPVLHVITVIFNFARYASRARNVRTVQTQMASYPGVAHYTVELVYGDGQFEATNASDPRHLQLRLKGDDTEPPLWHKENLVNVGVARLLPSDWAAVAWVDGEIAFANSEWATTTMRMITEEGFDAVMPWSSVLVYGSQTWRSAPAHLAQAGRLPSTMREFLRGGPHYSLAWAYSRATFERLGGLYELDLGSLNDIVTASALYSQRPHIADVFFPRDAAPEAFSDAFLTSVQGYVEAANARTTRQLKLGFVAGELVHTDHGSLLDRQYLSFRPKLKDFDPAAHLTHNREGLLVPTPAMPASIVSAVRAYFLARKEDEPMKHESLLVMLGAASDVA